MEQCLSIRHCYVLYMDYLTKLYKTHIVISYKYPHILQKQNVRLSDKK